jgi:2-polyprenyl-6-methoxyphenol hydroxylase-like FAD-dependent oxidoreductase
VQGAFGTVVLVVCGVGVAGAVVALLLGRRSWEDYGRNHLLMERNPPEPAGSAAALADRDEEIRQMLDARNARRRRRGEPELDVETELSRLTAPAVDDELRAEIRDLVIARNHRRARQGKPPLDVEAEVERQIAALSEL